jgi:hypothetical protein
MFGAVGDASRRSGDTGIILAAGDYLFHVFGATCGFPAIPCFLNPAVSGEEIKILEDLPPSSI